MKTTEFQNMGTSELHKLLAQKRNEVRECMFKVHEGQLKTVDKIKKIKKDIARILTRINQ